MRFTGEVGDAKTTAEIEKTDRRGRSLRQSQCKLETFALGFDDRFVRLWEFYLASCEAAFAVRYLSDLQLVMRRPLPYARLAA